MSVDDKYTIPGSGGLLRNRRGITDPDEFDRALNLYASSAWALLIVEDVPEPPGWAYLQAIHRRMFSPLLEWAGEIRDVDVAAGNTSIAYCRPEFIRANLEALFDRLADEDYLRGLDRESFAFALAERWGELSAIHPFRDGNTRSQSFYVTALAARAEYQIDWAGTDVDELRARRLRAVAGNERPLGEYLLTHLLPVER